MEKSCHFYLGFITYSKPQSLSMLNLLCDKQSIQYIFMTSNFPSDITRVSTHRMCFCLYRMENDERKLKVVTDHTNESDVDTFRSVAQ